ncbi:MAG: hypothetical protein C0510_10025 [Erythrobacter sp.]|nr:hypothetical protein [Erythrobacter sp.]
MMFDSRIRIPAGTAQVDGTALRSVAWSELAARLDAARDLRRELRRYSAFGGASFCDAAAGYFASLDQGKPGVNPDALSDGNRASCIEYDAQGEVATGERES